MLIETEEPMVKLSSVGIQVGDRQVMRAWRSARLEVNVKSCGPDYFHQLEDMLESDIVTEELFCDSLENLAVVSNGLLMGAIVFSMCNRINTGSISWTLRIIPFFQSRACAAIST